MADIEITQAEADALMEMEKLCADDKEWLFPSPGDQVAIPLISADKRKILYSISRAAKSNLRKRPTRTGRGR